MQVRHSSDTIQPKPDVLALARSDVILKTQISPLSPFGQPVKARKKLKELDIDNNNNNLYVVIQKTPK